MTVKIANTVDTTNTEFPRAKTMNGPCGALNRTAGLGEPDHEGPDDSQTCAVAIAQHHLKRRDANNGGPRSRRWSR